MRVATDRARLSSVYTHEQYVYETKSRFPRSLHPRSICVTYVHSRRTLVDREISISADWFGRPIRLTLSYRKPMRERRLENGGYAWFMDTRYCSRSCRHNVRRCFRSALSTSAQWMSTQIGELNYTVCPHPREICGLKKQTGTQDERYERIWVISREIQIAKLINSFNAAQCENWFQSKNV